MQEPKLQVLDQQPRQVAGVLRALTLALPDIPGDTFEPRSILESTGSDPAHVFAWVRDRTYWVPYRGVLRGARGVLMDRVGSSLDRALLLAELLADAGHTVRLARKTLTASRAEELLMRVRPVPPDPVQRHGAPRESDSSVYARYAAAAGMSAETVRDLTTAFVAKADALSAEMRRRLSAQVPYLLRTVGAPVSEPRGPAASAALSDHWWVQQLSGSAWIDLDPLLPDARPSASEGAPDQTFPYERNEGATTIEQGDYHSVTIRVIVGQWTGGQLQERVALTRTLRPAEVFGQSIVFRNIPREPPATASIATSSDSVRALQDYALRQTEWLPSLSVGDRTYEQASVTDAGDLNVQPRQAESRPASSGLTSSFDALSGEDASAAPGVLAAEWIEYEIDSPGRPAAVVRRDIFDAAARLRAGASGVLDDRTRLTRAVQLLETIEILPVSCRLSPEYTLFRTLSELLRQQDLLASVAARWADKDVTRSIEESVRLSPTSGRLFDLALARFTWSPVSEDTYLASPNVLTYRTGLVVDDLGRVVARAGFDILSNAVSVRPGARRSAFEVRITQGIADTNGEALLAGISVSNAGASLAESKVSKDWKTLRTRSDLERQGVAWPSDVRRALEAQLSGGYVLVVPPPIPGAAVDAPSVWWRIDPTTGETLGMGRSGWGQGLTEKILITALAFIQGGWATFLLCGNIQQARGNPNAVGTCLCAGLAGGAAIGGVATGGVLGLVIAMAVAAALKEALCA